MDDFLTLLSVIVLVFSFVRIKWGISLYILIIFLVPSLSVIHVGILQKWAVYNACFLLSIYVQGKIRKWDIFLIKPFLCLFLFYLLVIIFQFDTPYSYQFSNWFGQALRFLTVPIVMLTVFNEKESLSYITIPVYISILVACLYGLFLLNLEGVNPYLMLIVSDVEELEQYSLGGSGRLFGRVFSVFLHPMTFGVFLTCAFNYCLYKFTATKGVLKKCSFGVLLLLIVANAITCGVRSVIGALLVSIACFVYMNKKSKYLLYSILFLSLIWFIVSFYEPLRDLILSIFAKSDESTVQGSSLEMRIEQLVGCFEEVSNNPIFGHGYNWTAYYGQLHGDHPKVLAFESLVFVVLCNWALSGIIVWFIFLKKVFSNNRMLVQTGHDKYRVLNCLTISYLAYTCITGDYAYMMFWTFFYVLIYIEEKQKLKIDSNEKN